MSKIWGAILEDVLPTAILRWIAATILLLAPAAYALPGFLHDLGWQNIQIEETQLRTIALLATLALWLAVLLVFYILFHRAFRLALESFTEHRGAFFKKKREGGYHDAVYCGSCKISTAPDGSGMHSYERFVCKCGWRSDFTLNDLDRLFIEMK